MKIPFQPEVNRIRGIVNKQRARRKPRISKTYDEDRLERERQYSSRVKKSMRMTRVRRRRSYGK